MTETEGASMRSILAGEAGWGGPWATLREPGQRGAP